MSVTSCRVDAEFDLIGLPRPLPRYGHGGPSRSFPFNSTSWRYQESNKKRRYDPSSNPHKSFVEVQVQSSPHVFI